MTKSAMYLSASKRLIAARLNAGFPTAQKLAETISVEPHTYRMYERGQAFPRPHTLMRICKALGVTPNDLLTDD